MSLQNIILDTDIGDDADDVLAIAYALSHPDINLLGVTTVFRNTELRAKMAMHTLALAGRSDIGVYSGHGHGVALQHEVDSVPCQYTAAMDVYQPNALSAQEYFEQVLSKQRVTIVAIGPLTNIAQLLLKRPDLKSNIEKIVLMGGAYYRHANEWNIECDPEAADIVFRSGVELIGVGLDVTTQCCVPEAWLAQIAERDNTPLQSLLLESCRLWKRRSGFGVTLHDPLTIAVAANTPLVHLTHENVQIELSGNLTRGMTVCASNGLWGSPPESPNIYAASSCDATAYVREFMVQVFGVGEE